MNSVSQEVQTTIMSATKSDIWLSKDMKADNHTQYLRNQFYELTLFKPYLAMNYGTVDVNKIGETRIEKFLALNIHDKNYVEKLKMNIDEEIDKYHNIYMQSLLLDFKFIVAFISPIITIFVAIPFFVISMANLIIDILILVLIIVFPFFLVLSLLNLFSDKALKGCMLFISLFLFKILIAFCMIVLFVVIQISSHIIPIELGIGHYILTALMIIIIHMIIYKYRHTLIQMTSGGLIRIQVSANQELAKIQPSLNIMKEHH